MKTRVFKVGDYYYCEYSHGSGWWRFRDICGHDIYYSREEPAIKECKRRMELESSKKVVWSSDELE